MFLLWHYLSESARRAPSRPAVEWNDVALSYRELDEESNRVANLLGACGIAPGDRVGIHLAKSPRALSAALGVLKAGGVYVPIDPGAPPRRAAFVLNDCAMRGLITGVDQLARLTPWLRTSSSLELLVLAEDAEFPAGGGAGTQRRTWSDVERMPAEPPADAGRIESDPAYLLYTSGSTGNPKGVILSHRNAMAFAEWGAEAFAIKADDRLSNHAPLHFDLSVFDIYVALRCGACVVIVPDSVALFPMALARWIDARAISIWYSVPSALTRLLLHGRMERYAYRALRTVLFAGEVFPVKYLRGIMEWLPSARFFNLYGPTETNVCTYYQVPRPLGAELLQIPIGAACENTSVFALDEAGRLVEAGCTGELHVRGPTVMRGYWGMPDRTREVLVPNPLQCAFPDRVYRTGDLVRREADGVYAFVGRRDHMVKSRGYRIELGEVEAVLYKHGAVREAVALAIPDEEIGNRIEAIIASHPGHAPSEAELQRFCAMYLPRYMVPERFVFRSELPLTSTGKVDRMSLAGERRAAWRAGGGA